jgi:hypothetical protein
MELGEYKEAKSAYQRARQLDPYNSIAEKNLKRLSHLKNEAEAGKEETAPPVEPRYFIEETGKAGVVRLVNVAPKETLLRAVAGDRVLLEISDSNIMVKNEAGETLGWVDPRHGQRLARLMAGGNQYLASVISSTENNLAIIIRETFQHPSQASHLSFPSKGLESLHPLASDKLIRHQPGYEEEPGEEPGFGGTEEEGELGPPEENEGTEEEEG